MPWTPASRSGSRRRSGCRRAVRRSARTPAPSPARLGRLTWWRSRCGHCLAVRSGEGRSTANSQLPWRGLVSLGQWAPSWRPSMSRQPQRRYTRPRFGFGLMTTSWDRISPVEAIVGCPGATPRPPAALSLLSFGAGEGLSRGGRSSAAAPSAVRAGREADTPVEPGEELTLSCVQGVRGFAPEYFPRSGSPPRSRGQAFARGLIKRALNVDGHLDLRGAGSASAARGGFGT